jgi:protein-S-isoprenylcysteine O-methyltransferase Ste14
LRRGRAVLGTAAVSLLVPGTAGGWLPWLLPHAAVPPAEPWAWAGLALVAAGASLYAWCAAEFARGGGTPLQGAEPPALVARGPYRVVRHPMYLAVFCAILGWAVFLRSFWVLAYAALFAVAAAALVAFVEEPLLRRRLGAAWAEHCSGVPRWLPRWPRRAGRGGRRASPAPGPPSAPGRGRA